VNENIASMLLTEVRRAGLPARRRRRPVRDRPALSMFDYVALSGTTQGVGSSGSTTCTSISPRLPW